MIGAFLLALSVATSATPSLAAAGAGQGVPTGRLPGFAAVVSKHIERVMGTDKLPAGRGRIVEPGVFVTVALDEVQIFDHQAVALQQGRVARGEAPRQCAGQCPAALFDAFQARWLAMAVESASLDVEIPSRVLFGADASLPVRTLLEVAYAAADTRPGQTPSLHLLLNSPGRGLQAMPFHLIPPRGLELRQGAGAALALTIEISTGSYLVQASDPDFARARQARDLTAMRKIVSAVKKKYPGKSAVILVPDSDVSVGEVLRVVGTIAEQFDRVIFSAGQDVIVP